MSLLPYSKCELGVGRLKNLRHRKARVSGWMNQVVELVLLSGVVFMRLLWPRWFFQLRVRMQQQRWPDCGSRQVAPGLAKVTFPFPVSQGTPTESHVWVEFPGLQPLCSSPGSNEEVWLRNLAWSKEMQRHATATFLITVEHFIQLHDEFPCIHWVPVLRSDPARNI